MNLPAAVPTARIRLDENTFQILLPWIIGIVVVIGGLYLVGVLLTAFSKTRPLRSSAEFPVDGDEARDLAVGAIQLTTSKGAWNDPEGRDVANSPELSETIIEMWGITTRDEWLETIRELPVRRSEPVRDAVMHLRSQVRDSLGKEPSYRQMVKALKENNLSNAATLHALVTIMEIEGSLCTKVNRVTVLPKDEIVRSAMGYVYGQQVALAVWGVALGFATRAEIRPIIREISANARAEFGSWEEFGRSYLFGRVLRLVENGSPVEAAAELSADGPDAYTRALLDGANPGPWKRLAW